jgi:hypothetical protein
MVKQIIYFRTDEVSFLCWSYYSGFSHLFIFSIILIVFFALCRGNTKEKIEKNSNSLTTNGLGKCVVDFGRCGIYFYVQNTREERN